MFVPGKTEISSLIGNPGKFKQSGKSGVDKPPLDPTTDIEKGKSTKCIGKQVSKNPTTNKM